MVVWTALVTNLSYLTGLLTLDYSLKKSGSKYPLVALFTDSLPFEGLNILKARGIPTRHISFLQPTVHKDYGNDVRFYNCWSKLASFSLVEYDRVVQLDSDMLVLQNMDELMELELDDAALKGRGQRVFAACHACTCNPLNIPHYPSDWYVDGPLDWLFAYLIPPGSRRTVLIAASIITPIKHKSKALSQGEGDQC